MPGNVPPVPDERAGLLGFLAQQRYVLRLTAHGLTDEQARATPTKSSLSVGGLIKHVMVTEDSWIRRVRHEPQPEVDYLGMFRFGPDDTLDGVLADYAATAAHTEEVLAGIADLGAPVPVPKDVPWFPKDVDNWSVRWVLLHLIEETARHAGHADLVREHVDGATAYPLMAAAEGWPETPWITPWRPASEVV